jgi:hypothetical protein
VIAIFPRTSPAQDQRELRRVEEATAVAVREDLEVGGVDGGRLHLDEELRGSRRRLGDVLAQAQILDVAVAVGGICARAIGDTLVRPRTPARAA